MSLTNIIAWVIFGLVAGVVAKFLMPGRDPMGWIITIVLGIVGAFVGGFIGNALFGGGNAATSGPFDIYGFALAVVGAIVVLAIYRLATGRNVT